MTRKKKLLIILGAGSSLPLGMPSVGSLGRAMRDWSHDWLNDKGESGPASESCFGKIWDSIERYYQSSDRTIDPELQPHVNYEKALGEMLALAHWMMPAPYGATFRQIASNNEAPPDLHFPSDTSTNRYGPAILINTEQSYLLGRLTKHMRSLCREFNEEGDDFQSYKRLFDALHTAFDVGVYNLNYDNMALRSCPDAFTGFGPDGVFDSSAVCSRQDWGFIYHLHGSVHHTLAGESNWAMRWQSDLRSPFIDGHGGRWTEALSDEKPFQASTLVAGGFKLDQLLIEPFQSFYSTFVRHMHEADAVLIGGYGFGDAHVNRTLRQRFRSAAERNRPRPPVVVIDHYVEKTLGQIRRDMWSSNMDVALNTAEYATRVGRVHVSEAHKIAKWFDGIVEAANRPDVVVSWLDNPDVEALKAALER